MENMIYPIYNTKVYVSIKIIISLVLNDLCKLWNFP